MFDALCAGRLARAAPSRLNYGVRYEFFAPYTEKYGHLADVDTNPGRGIHQRDGSAVGRRHVQRRLPDSLVFPFRTAFAPRIGIGVAGAETNGGAGRLRDELHRGPVLRRFATTMAHQPPFANEQTNEEAMGNTAPARHARAHAGSCFTLANGFPAPDTVGNYALDPHYGCLMCRRGIRRAEDAALGRRDESSATTGRRATIWTSRSAPRATPQQPGHRSNGTWSSPTTQAEAFSKLNAGTVRVNKRLSKGIALGANYQYSHSIDDAGSVNGTSRSVAQNWQNLQAEEGNSSFDIRHQVSGTYLYEFPFGKDKFWVTSRSWLAYSGRVFGLRHLYTLRPATRSRRVIRRRVRALPAARRVRCGRIVYRCIRHGRRRVAEAVVQSCGLFTATGTPGFCNALAMRRAIRLQGRGRSEQYVAFEDDANGRHAQHGDSRHASTMSSIRCSIRAWARAMDYADVWAVTSAAGCGRFSLRRDSDFSEFRGRAVSGGWGDQQVVRGE